MGNVIETFGGSDGVSAVDETRSCQGQRKAWSARKKISLFRQQGVPRVMSKLETAARSARPSTIRDRQCQAACVRQDGVHPAADLHKPISYVMFCIPRAG